MNYSKNREIMLVDLYKKERKKFYGNLDLNDVLDNKTFWKHMNHF